MNNPCGLIKDLMPLYIEDMCSAESKIAIEDHISGCEKCREYLEKMKSGENREVPAADAEMARSLKSVKHRIDRKMKKAVVCTALAALVLLTGFYVMFELPLKELGPEDLNVSVQMYPIAELAAGEYNAGSVHISVYEDDSEYVTLKIPGMGDAEVSVSESVTEKYDCISVINCTSPYDLRELNCVEGPEEDAVYIGSAKTTILNNRAPAEIHHAQMEFREINKIVYVGDGGETVLWSK